MSAEDSDSRPADNGPASESLGSDDDSTCQSYFLRTRRVRHNIQVAVYRERRCELAAEPRPAGTFGLTIEERRQHARALFRDGWTVEEITKVLDVEVVR